MELVVILSLAFAGCSLALGLAVLRHKHQMKALGLNRPDPELLQVPAEAQGDAALSIIMQRGERQRYAFWTSLLALAVAGAVAVTMMLTRRPVCSELTVVTSIDQAGVKVSLKSADGSCRLEEVHVVAEFVNSSEKATSVRIDTPRTIIVPKELNVPQGDIPVDAVAMRATIGYSKGNRQKLAASDSIWIPTSISQPLSTSALAQAMAKNRCYCAWPEIPLGFQLSQTSVSRPADPHSWGAALSRYGIEFPSGEDTARCQINDGDGDRPYAEAESKCTAEVRAKGMSIESWPYQLACQSLVRCGRDIPPKGDHWH